MNTQVTSRHISPCSKCARSKVRKPNGAVLGRKTDSRKMMSCPLRTTPRDSPRGRRLGAMPLPALEIAPGGMTIGLHNPGQGPRTSRGKQNHNTKSCRLCQRRPASTASREHMKNVTFPLSRLMVTTKLTLRCSQSVCLVKNSTTL